MQGAAGRDSQAEGDDCRPATSAGQAECRRRSNSEQCPDASCSCTAVIWHIQQAAGMIYGNRGVGSWLMLSNMFLNTVPFEAIHPKVFFQFLFILPSESSESVSETMNIF